MARVCTYATGVDVLVRPCSRRQPAFQVWPQSEHTYFWMVSRSCAYVPPLMIVWTTTRLPAHSPQGTSPTNVPPPTPASRSHAASSAARFAAFAASAARSSAGASSAGGSDTACSALSSPRSSRAATHPASVWRSAGSSVRSVVRYTAPVSRRPGPRYNARSSSEADSSTCECASASARPPPVPSVCVRSAAASMSRAFARTGHRRSSDDERGCVLVAAAMPEAGNATCAASPAAVAPTTAFGASLTPPPPPPTPPAAKAAVSPLTAPRHAAVTWRASAATPGTGCLRSAPTVRPAPLSPPLPPPPPTPLSPASAAARSRSHISRSPAAARAAYLLASSALAAPTTSPSGRPARAFAFTDEPPLALPPPPPPRGPRGGWKDPAMRRLHSGRPAVAREGADMGPSPKSGAGAEQIMMGP
eukprot:148879-Chlamydomonas_euryale.AAC.3